MAEVRAGEARTAPSAPATPSSTSSRPSSAAAAEDKPWLASDGEAPTLEETRARIEWEAEEQRRRAEAAPAAATARATAHPRPAAPAAGQRGPRVAAARIELDRQARESRERLEAIRKELGVDPPEDRRRA